MQDRVYMEEAVKVLHRSDSTLRRWERLGFGPRPYRDGRRVFYLRADIEEYLDAQLANQK